MLFIWNNHSLSIFFCYLLLAIPLLTTSICCLSDEHNAPPADHDETVSENSNIKTKSNSKESPVVYFSKSSKSESPGHKHEVAHKIQKVFNEGHERGDWTTATEHIQATSFHEKFKAADDDISDNNNQQQQRSLKSPSTTDNPETMKYASIRGEWEDTSSHESRVMKDVKEESGDRPEELQTPLIEKVPVTSENKETSMSSIDNEKDVVTSAPSPPPHVELTEVEGNTLKNKKLEDLYQEGMKLINSSNVKPSIARGYQLLRDAATLGHADADVEIGFAHLKGVHLPLQIGTAKEIFVKHAEMGNPRAQAGLGFMYGTGLGTNSSQAKSLVYLTFSALGNDVMGSMMLGYRYWAGVAVSKSCETALNYYRRVAEKVAASMKLTGSSLLMRVRLLDEADRPGSNYGVIDDDLVQYYQFLADKGDAPAQVTLGQLNYQGSQGFEQNLEKAFDYFNRAAESGNANAQGYLGKMFAEGTDMVKPNNDTALKYFKLAAAQGNAIGQAGLGLMYLHGKGVKVDFDKAFKNFQASADQGWPEGQLHLGNMYFNGHGTSRDYKQALRCFNLAAQNGHLLALYYLAKMHATGTGVVRSCQTAVELHKNVCERGRWSSQFDLAHRQYKAGRIDSALSIYLFLAELGYEVAQSNVAYILDQEQSNLVPNQTFARALIHWDRAAEQGYSIARIKLGDYHYYGKGTDVDYEIAASHYKLATEQNNNAQAMFNLGYMHEQGLGMKKDIHLAKRHYDMAADASADAFAPVSLALIKIGFLFAIDFLQNQRWFYNGLSKISPFLSDNWDLYLMTILALLLGFVVAFRRQRR